MHNVSESIANILYDNGFVSREEKDICKYGIEYFLISVLEIISVLIISVFIGNFVNTLIYFIAFIPLRIYAGGYHADSRLSCYIILLVTYIIFTFIIKYLPDNVHIYVAFFALIDTSFIIFKYAPLVSEKRNTKYEENMFYRKISKIIVCFENFVILIFIVLQNTGTIFLSFCLGQMSVSFAMIAALIKNKVKEVKK